MSGDFLDNEFERKRLELASELLDFCDDLGEKTSHERASPALWYLRLLRTKRGNAKAFPQYHVPADKTLAAKKFMATCQKKFFGFVTVTLSPSGLLKLRLDTDTVQSASVAVGRLAKTSGSGSAKKHPESDDDDDDDQNVTDEADSDEEFDTAAYLRRNNASKRAATEASSPKKHRKKSSSVKKESGSVKKENGSVKKEPKTGVSAKKLKKENIAAMERELSSRR